MFLAETAPQSEFITRKYFEESVYRNILDLLTNLSDKADFIARELVYTGANTIGIKNKWTLYYDKAKRPVIGAAVNAVGKGAGEKGIDTYYWWVKKVARENKFEIKPTRAPLGVKDTQVQDLLNIGRSINMEMNRVRLPVPNNFLQFLEKLTKYKLTFALGGGIPMASGNFIVGGNEIQLIEAIKVLRQLIDSIKVIQGEIRVIIDKAKLEVQEETIRRESDRLRNDKELAEQAAKEKARIEAEKQDYLRRIEKLEAERATALEQTTNIQHAAVLDSELKQLTEQKQVAETVATEQQKNLIVTAATTGTIPVQPSVEKAVEKKFTGNKLLPIVAGAFALYSMT